MEITNGKTENINTVTTEHSYIEVYKGIYAYKFITMVENGNPNVDDEFSEEQGVTDSKGISLMKKGLPPFKGRKDKRQFFIMSGEDIKAIQNYGAIAYNDRNFKGFKRHDVFDWLSNDGNKNNVIRCEVYDYSFWRLDGTLIPTAIHVDYIDARFHNGLYDLEKAFKHLSAREDVHFVPEGKDGIQDIPYYNAQRGRNRFLHFMWTPNQEQAERLRIGSMERHKLIFDEDMLGLRAAGIAKTDSFYKDDEEGDDEEDDN